MSTARHITHVTRSGAKATDDAVEPVQVGERGQDQAAFEALVAALAPRDVPTSTTVLTALANAELRTEFMREWGGLTSAQVARLVGSEAKNLSAIASRWRAAGRIFSVPWAERSVFPVFQFGADGMPEPAVADVLEAFGPRVTPWEVALWFVAPSSYLTGDARPVDCLHDRKALAEAARAAISLPEF